MLTQDVFQFDGNVKVEHSFELIGSLMTHSVLVSNMMQYHFKETKGGIFIVRLLHAMLDCVTFMIESNVI